MLAKLHLNWSNLIEKNAKNIHSVANYMRHRLRPVSQFGQTSRRYGEGENRHVAKNRLDLGHFSAEMLNF